MNVKNLHAELIHKEFFQSPQLEDIMPVKQAIFKRGSSKKRPLYDFITGSCHNFPRRPRIKVNVRPHLALKIILIVFLSGLIDLSTIGGTPSARAADQSKPRMVTFFTTTVDRCPEGWREADYAQGRLLLGTSDASRVLSRGGEPMAYGKATQHGHKIAATINTSEILAQGHSEYVFLDNIGPDQELVFNKSYNITGKTRDIDKGHHGEIPYRQMLVCEEESVDVANKFPGQVASFFRGNSCPAGWEKFNALDGRFLLPNPPNAAADRIGAMVGGKLAIGSNGMRKTKHRHSIEIGSAKDKLTGVKLELATVKRNYYLKNWAKLATGTIEDQKISTEDSTQGHPYIELLACYKKDGEDLPQEEFPDGLSIFYLGGRNCPLEWTEYTASRGYYLTGLPKSKDGRERQNGLNVGGSPLMDAAMASHTHPVDLDLDISQSNFYSSIWNGIFAPLNDYAKWGSYDASGNSGAATARLPFMTATHCHIPEQHLVDPGERAQ